MEEILRDVCADIEVKLAELVRHYWRAQKLWSGSSYAGSADGAPISVLRRYIEQQNRPA